MVLELSSPCILLCMPVVSIKTKNLLINIDRQICGCGFSYSGVRCIWISFLTSVVLSGMPRRMSDLYAGCSLANEMQEKRMVDLYLIRSGMMRFNLLLGVSQPGTLPEPEFIAALLELVCMNPRMREN